MKFKLTEDDRIIDMNEIEGAVVGNNIWFKREKEQETYYSLSPNYKTKFYIPNDSDDQTILEDIKEFRKENNQNACQSVEKINGTNIYHGDVQIQEEKVQLPAGTYYYAPERGYDEPGRLVLQSFRTDEYLNVFSQSREIQEQMHKFLGKEKLYKELNCIYKLSIMLYGPQGEGKTSLLRHLVNTDEKFKNAIVITISDMFPPVSFIQKLDRSTRGTLKVFILEEITNLSSTEDQIRQLLTFLDGENSVDNCIILSTTNYPELLPKNIVERPSRIDKLYKMGSPKKEEAKQLIKHYYKTEPTEIELEQITGKSSAFIKEICLNALINEISLLESLDRVKAMFKTVSDDFNDKKLGISE